MGSYTRGARLDKEKEQSYIYNGENRSIYENSDLYKNIEMIVYSTVCFFAPIVFSHGQIVVGVIVNTMIALAALNLKGYRLLPVILLPSLGAVSAGLLFGNLTAFLIYMVPFIWIGNAILAMSISLLKVKRKVNYILAMPAGALMKSGFLFISAFALYSLGLLPAVFLTAMGIMQLATALIGGSAAYLLNLAKNKFLA